ncbi:MAG: hypothetical protein AAF367_02455 [Pseudomonadota bacterium]
MNRLTSTLASAAILSVAAPALAPAQDATGLDAYLEAIAAAQISFDAACETMRDAVPPEGRVWLRRGAGGIEIAPDTARAAEAAAFWAEAALGARAAATVLYGAAITDHAQAEPVMIESSSAGVMVHDGARMSDGDACDALQTITRGLGRGVGTAGSGDPFAAARDLATSPARVTLAIGGTVAAPVGTGVGANGIARGPDGISAEIINGDAGLEMIAAANADAVPGTAQVRLYDPADPFVPVDTIDLTILPAPAPPPPPATAEMNLGSSYAGTLPLGGTQDIKLTVAETQTVSFSSASESDLKAVLETSDGRIIASDDDSGGRYGFSLTAELPAGQYQLRVSHCCGGGGGFVVTTADGLTPK